MSTFKPKYNNKYGFPKNEAHSLADISKTTSIKKSILQDVYNRGIGAAKTSGISRPQVKSKEQWAYARVYGFVMKNPKQVGEGKPDNDLYKKIV